jgi:hypothetical protein
MDLQTLSSKMLESQPVARNRAWLRGVIVGVHALACLVSVIVGVYALACLGDTLKRELQLRVLAASLAANKTAIAFFLSARHAFGETTSALQTIKMHAAARTLFNP